MVAGELLLQGDLDRLRAAARRRDFHPVPLGVRFSIELKCDVHEQQTANVLGVLEGSDPQLRREMPRDARGDEGRGATATCFASIARRVRAARLGPGDGRAGSG